MEKKYEVIKNNKYSEYKIYYWYQKSYVPDTAGTRLPYTCRMVCVFHVQDAARRTAQKSGRVSSLAGRVPPSPLRQRSEIIIKEDYALDTLRTALILLYLWYATCKTRRNPALQFQLDLYRSGRSASPLRRDVALLRTIYGRTIYGHDFCSPAVCQAS